MNERYKEIKEDENRSAEVGSLMGQFKESQKQTQEIARQTRYISYGVLIALLGVLYTIITN